MNSTAQKPICVLAFSQTGQGTGLANSFLKPFQESGFKIDWINIIPESPFPFPWSKTSFFDAMPESVLEIPKPIKQIEFAYAEYAFFLVVWQPWFLSPSIPITSCLKNPRVMEALNNQQVITLGGARNMWISAQEKLDRQIRDSGATVAGKLVVTDHQPNLISAITIQYWMFTGKKDRMWGIFPKPGIHHSHIQQASTFGKEVLRWLMDPSINLQQSLVRKGGLRVLPGLLFVESRAKIIFRAWASLIIKKKNRNLWLKIFNLYLLIALFVIAPVVLSVYTIFFRPFMGAGIRKQTLIHLGLN